jgi:peptide deformylase
MASPSTSSQSDSAQDKRDALAAKYESIPFDDSRVVKYRETPGWEVLLTKAAEVTQFDADLRALVAEMADIMYTAHGVGLAAPQIGRSIRLLVYDAGDGLKALINPVILKMRGEQFEPEEGCLSIPGLRGVVRRANQIQVRALDLTGRATQFRATEFEARVIQHEIDHLDGILFTERADAGTLRMLTPQEQADEHRQVEAE